MPTHGYGVKVKKEKSGQLYWDFDAVKDKPFKARKLIKNQNKFIKIPISDDNIQSLRDGFSVVVEGSNKKFYRLIIR